MKTADTPSHPCMADATTPNTSVCDFAAFQTLQGSLSKGLLILVDHASPALPVEYGTLGLDETQFSRHIAYDIGIEGVARGLHRELDVPVVMSQFSRLLIDPNRGADDPTLVMQISGGAVIPANANVDRQEVASRIERFHKPYHGAIATLIDQFLEAGICPIIISLHSFTASWRGVPRPWQAGILWDQDARFVKPLINALREEPQLMVGDNQPYTGQIKGDCMYTHGTQRGLAHALIEIRQDLIANEAGQLEWAARLSEILTRLLGDEKVIAPCRQACHFGCYAD